jgi:AcrR family transcriptional regulator
VVRAQSTKSGDGSRLDIADWAKAALEQLASYGIDGVRIELLAKKLGVTKGSFYWHFKDRDALHGHMLDEWRRDATLKLIERVKQRLTTPEERLRHLLQLPFRGRVADRAADVELAIRLWGRRDERAANALKEVDDQRLLYIRQLFEDLGLSVEESRSRAVIAYSYIRVSGTLIRTDVAEQIDGCEDFLLSRPA